MLFRSYFLQWFQEHNSSVFVAATANEPWKLKPELIRRFTKCFLVDLPNIPARRGIFQVQMERYRLLETIGPDIANEWLDRLSEQTADFTGDEIRKVVHESAITAYASGRPGQTRSLGSSPRATKHIKYSLLPEHNKSTKRLSYLLVCFALRSFWALQRLFKYQF